MNTPQRKRIVCENCQLNGVYSDRFIVEIDEDGDMILRCDTCQDGTVVEEVRDLVNMPYRHDD